MASLHENILLASLYMQTLQIILMLRAYFYDMSYLIYIYHITYGSPYFELINKPIFCSFLHFFFLVHQVQNNLPQGQKKNRKQAGYVRP